MSYRKMPRIHVNLPAVSGGSLLSVVQLSDGGGLLAGEASLGEAGDIIAVSIAIDGNDVLAKVRLTTLRSQDGKKFTGFSFEELSRRGSAILHDYLAKKMMENL